MALDMPPTVSALGNKVVVFLTTPPVATTGIPTLTEVNAALFASLHLYTPFNVTPSQNTGEGPRKVGQRQVPTELGLVSFPAVEVSYSYVPQELGTPGSDGNELYEALVPGDQVTAVVLDGLDGENTSAVVAGDICDIYLMECGVRRKGQTGDDEYAKLNTLQSLIVVGGAPIAEDHALAA
jgi:hypothetical protein